MLTQHRKIWPELKAIRFTHFHDGDEIEVTTTDDLHAAALIADGHTLNLYVSASGAELSALG